RKFSVAATSAGRPRLRWPDLLAQLDGERVRDLDVLLRRLGNRRGDEGRDRDGNQENGEPECRPAVEVDRVLDQRHVGARSHAFGRDRLHLEGERREGTEKARRRAGRGRRSRSEVLQELLADLVIDLYSSLRGVEKQELRLPLTLRQVELARRRGIR